MNHKLKKTYYIKISQNTETIELLPSFKNEEELYKYIYKIMTPNGILQGFLSKRPFVIKNRRVYYNDNVIDTIFDFKKMLWDKSKRSVESPLNAKVNELYDSTSPIIFNWFAVQLDNNEDVINYVLHALKTYYEHGLEKLNSALSSSFTPNSLNEEDIDAIKQSVMKICAYLKDKTDNNKVFTKLLEKFGEPYKLFSPFYLDPEQRREQTFNRTHYNTQSIDATLENSKGGTGAELLERKQHESVFDPSGGLAQSPEAIVQKQEDTRQVMLDLPKVWDELVHQMGRVENTNDVNQLLTKMFHLKSYYGQNENLQLLDPGQIRQDILQFDVESKGNQLLSTLNRLRPSMYKKESRPNLDKETMLRKMFVFEQVVNQKYIPALMNNIINDNGFSRVAPIIKDMKPFFNSYGRTEYDLNSQLIIDFLAILIKRIICVKELKDLNRAYNIGDIKSIDVRADFPTTMRMYLLGQTLDNPNVIGGDFKKLVEKYPEEMDTINALKAFVENTFQLYYDVKKNPEFSNIIESKNLPKGTYATDLAQINFPSRRLYHQGSILYRAAVFNYVKQNSPYANKHVTELTEEELEDITGKTYEAMNNDLFIDNPENRKYRTHYKHILEPDKNDQISQMLPDSEKEVLPLEKEMFEPPLENVERTQRYIHRLPKDDPRLVPVKQKGSKFQKLTETPYEEPETLEAHKINRLIRIASIFDNSKYISDSLDRLIQYELKNYTLCR